MITKTAINYAEQVAPYIDSSLRGAGIGAVSGAGLGAFNAALTRTNSQDYIRKKYGLPNDADVTLRNILRGAAYGAAGGALLGPVGLMSTGNVNRVLAEKNLRTEMLNTLRDSTSTAEKAFQALEREKNVPFANLLKDMVAKAEEPKPNDALSILEDVTQRRIAKQKQEKALAAIQEGKALEKQLEDEIAKIKLPPPDRLETMTDITGGVLGGALAQYYPYNPILN